MKTNIIMNELNEKDKCVLCGKETVYDKETPIELRENYIEGAGQLCPECAKRINKE